MEVFTTDFLHATLIKMATKMPTLPFVHVGALDSWPETIKYGDCALMIFNTEYASQRGEHWIAVYVDGKNAFYVDSFPMRPFPQRVLVKLTKLYDKVENVNREGFILQNPLSPLCGVYCLAFLLYAGHGQTLKLCADNVLQNDVHVLDVVLPYLCV